MRIELEDHRQYFNLIKRGLEISNDVVVDLLDCSKSWRREPIDVPPEEILKKDGEKYIRFYFRTHGQENRKYEISYSVFKDSKEYFIWIYLKDEDFSKIMSEFKLIFP